MKSGKRLEENVKKSALGEGLHCERLKDSSASWGGAENVRFAAKNISDFYIFNGYKLLYLEAKNHKGKSLPISCIRKNQKEKMTEVIQHINIIAGLLVFFEDLEKCYYLSIEDYNNFLEKEERKSIPVEYFEKHAKKIGVTKLKTNFRYCLTDIFE
jgi:recombination protein U